MTGVPGAIVFDQLVGLVLTIAIFLPGFSAFYFLLQASKTFDIPWLWDPSVAIAGVVGGAASYPFHAAVAQSTDWYALGIGFAMYRAAIVGITVACTCVFVLIWAEGTGRVEPPEPLAPIADRFDGTKYE